MSEQKQNHNKTAEYKELWKSAWDETRNLVKMVAEKKKINLSTIKIVRLGEREL